MRSIGGRLFGIMMAMSVAVSGVAVPTGSLVAHASEVSAVDSYDLFKYHDYSENGSSSKFLLDVTEMVESDDTVLNMASSSQVVTNITDCISIAIPTYKVFRFKGWYWYDSQHNRYVLKSKLNTYIKSSDDKEKYYPIYVFDKTLETGVSDVQLNSDKLPHCDKARLDTSKLYPKSTEEVQMDTIAVDKVAEEKSTDDGILLNALETYKDFKFYAWYRVEDGVSELFSENAGVYISSQTKGVSYYPVYTYDATHEAINYNKYVVCSSTENNYVGTYGVVLKSDGSIESVFNTSTSNIFKGVSTLEDCEYEDSMTFEANEELEDYKGYHFIGWSTTPDGSDIKRFDGTKYDDFYIKTLNLTSQNRQILFPVYSTSNLEVTNTLQVGDTRAKTGDVFIVDGKTAVKGNYAYDSKIEIYNAYNIDGILYVGTKVLNSCDAKTGMVLTGKEGKGYAIKYLNRWYFYIVDLSANGVENITNNFDKYMGEISEDNLDGLDEDVLTPISATMGDPDFDGSDDSDDDSDEDVDDKPIDINLDDVVNNSTSGTYSKGLYFKFTDKQQKVVLDGKTTYYDSTFTVDEDGEHTLLIYNADGTTTEYKFTVDKTAPVVNGFKDGYAKITDKITFEDAITGVESATLDGEPVESGFVVEQEGTHTLVVTDKAGNKKTIKFAVDNSFPKVSGVASGKTYSKAVTIKCSDLYSGIKYISLNDKSIKTPSYKVTSSGDYKLTVEDNVGFATQLHFKVRIKATGVKGVKNKKTYKRNVRFKLTGKKSEIKLVKLNNKSISIKKAVKGYSVKKNGSYKLVIKDKSGHTAKVAFKIKKK